MPRKKSAFKELKKSKKRHLRNISAISKLKSAAKKIETSIQEKKVDEAKTQLLIFASQLNKAAAKDIVHRNLASRKIARLTKKIYLISKT